MARIGRVRRVKVVGAIPSFAFQRAKWFALELHRSLPLRFPAPQIVGLLEVEWCERLTRWRRVYGSPFWRLRRPVAVFLDGEFIGSDVDLLRRTSMGSVFVEFVPGKDSRLVRGMFREDYLARLKGDKLTYCYFDICVDDNFAGTLVFQLYSDILPKTCANFTTLCLGTKGSILSYKGSRIHRIVKGGWLQGGDIQYKTGGGGFSVYCSPLEDECYGVRHDRRGVLSMANDGKHTNGSQFFVTLAPTPWMDTYYVAFGQVVEGAGLLALLEGLDTFRECPLPTVEIKNCGKLDLQDTDDVDMRYEPDMRDAEPRKGPKRIERIADQVVRLIMEAVTECLAMKERAPDVVHEGDVPSRVSLDLYFGGLYSVPEEVAEDAAKYLRTLRRSLYRQLKPSATEVVEVVTYDLLEGLFTRLVDLDDVRETTSHPVYRKLLDGIDMEVEMADKDHVRKFVEQLASTAETTVRLISAQLNWMRKTSLKARVFQEQLDEWVESFALQETFADDNFKIAERAETRPARMTGPCEEEGEVAALRPKTKKPPETVRPCCGVIVRQKKEKRKKRLGKEQTAVDVCCDGKEDSEEEVLKVSDFFSACRYGLKTVQRDRSERIPILDLIELGRFQLRVLRHHEDRKRSKARICLEKRINRWMKDVVYVSETEWVRQTVFGKEDTCISHTEEVMYGAMTVGLLEMYFLMEAHLKKPKLKKYLTRVIYPEEESSAGDGSHPGGSSNEESTETTGGAGSARTKTGKKVGPGTAGGKDTDTEDECPEEAEIVHKPCRCGDICCDCTSEPGGAGDEDDNDDSGDGRDNVPDEPIPVPPTPPPSLKTSYVSEEGEGDFDLPTGSCIPSVAEMEVEDLLAQVTGEPSDKVNVKSFRWLQDYILEKGCELKSEFAGQVHSWLESEVFRYRGFLSKHSLVSRASLLSFSYSLASLIREENDLKTEVKDFVFDLWELYFREMVNEARLEHPPESAAGSSEESVCEEGEGEDKTTAAVSSAEGDDDDDDPCSKAKKLVKDDFDFDKFCRENAQKAAGVTPKKPETEQEAKEVETVEKETEEGASQEQQPPPQPPPPEVPPNPDESVAGESSIPEVAEPPAKTTAVDRPREEAEAEVKPPKRARSPIVIRELVASSEEIRQVAPYAPPFWVKFLTEVTKRALGLIAKFSRLPRRLYFTTDSSMSFDDKMKEWIEFNNFSLHTTGGRDIRDFIAKHHVSVENLDDTARSFLRKRVVAQLIEKSSRPSSAQELAGILVLDILARAMEKAGVERKVPEELFEDLAGWAAGSSRADDGEDERGGEAAATDEDDGARTEVPEVE